MKIVMIGAGNVATHLSKALQKSGINICQVYSKTTESAETLANELNIAWTTNLADISTDADIYIYCVKDSVLEEVISKINAPEATHIHTAGSVSISVFAPYFKKYGVLYPLQTFSKNKEVNFRDIPIFIEANSPETENTINNLSNHLTEKIYKINSDQRMKVHLSAIFACNFTNFMYNEASELIKEAGLPFEILIPLISETADKIKTLSPFEAQTGPAIRFDENIINKHISLLSKDQDKKFIYKELSELIHKKHERI